MKRAAMLAAGLALGLGCLGLAAVARPGAGSAAGSAAGAAGPAAGKEPGEGAPRLAASRVTRVTVYPDSALVTREVEVPEGPGLAELVVSPLPEMTVNSSLYSEGGEGIRVLTTRFRVRPVREDTREEVRQLEAALKKLRQEQVKLSSEAMACQTNLGLLTKLEGYATSSTVHATEKGKLDSEAAITLAKYVMEGRAEKSRALVELQEKQRENQEEMEHAQRKLRDVTAGTSQVERDAVIVVDKANGGAGKLRLNYLVTSASWRPQYKFRMGKGGKEGVTVEYLAALTQQTGEEWGRVELVLSTAQPMLNSAPPELKTLAVAVIPRGTPMPTAQLDLNAYRSGPGANSAPMPPQEIVNPSLATNKVDAKELHQEVQKLRVLAQQQANLRNETKAAEINNYASALDQARDLVMMESGKDAGTGRAGKNEGPSVTYHLAGKLSVPSRADEQVVEVARLEMKPDYFYKAVPVLTPHVYRQATLVNRSTEVLLPGEATMYNGSDFVGRMNLPLVAVGEEFTVGFGTEPQLQVQRQLVDKSRTMQGGNQILRYEYRILVSSYKGEKARVQVWDRLPHAESEAMGVTLVKAAPELSKDALYAREERVNNLLRWDVEVGPEDRGEKASEIRYEFKLELDRQAHIGSFMSK